MVRQQLLARPLLSLASCLVRRYVRTEVTAVVVDTADSAAAPRLNGEVIASTPNPNGMGVRSLYKFSSIADLPQQDEDANVTVQVTHSSVNYKDGLILLGKPGVVDNFPIVPGIDFAGTVIESQRPDLFNTGDSVVLTGNKCGQTFDGGFADHARVKAEWLVQRPSGLSAEKAMALGTAGFTAMMCIEHLEKFGELQKDTGEVLVTGAGGGVGHVAIAILAARGYTVVASTGRTELEPRLKSLGASRVIGRLEHDEKRPLGKQLWGAVVDTVGGSTLAAAMATTTYGGAIASTGVAGGGVVNTTVFPLILRGVRVLGVDSTLPWAVSGKGYPPSPARWEKFRAERISIWKALERDVSDEAMKLIHTSTVPLDALLDSIPHTILEGGVLGRTVVEI